MDLIYSYLLLTSLVIGAAGSIGTLVLLRGLPEPDRSRRGLPRICLVCGVTAFACGIASAIVHLIFGHSPSTPEPMELVKFAQFHKAFWIAFGFGSISILGWRRARLAARSSR